MVGVPFTGTLGNGRPGLANLCTTAIKAHISHDQYRTRTISTISNTYQYIY